MCELNKLIKPTCNNIKCEYKGSQNKLQYLGYLILKLREKFQFFRYKFIRFKLQQEMKKKTGIHK